MVGKEKQSVRQALRKRSGMLIGVAVFSGVINVLALTGALVGGAHRGGLSEGVVGRGKRRELWRCWCRRRCRKEQLWPLPTCCCRCCRRRPAGVSARRRKQELEKLNEQLRTINTQLRCAGGWRAAGGAACLAARVVVRCSAPAPPPG